MDDVEQRRQDKIREVAHRIWREEGCPDGRADAHWQMARDLVAVEEGYEHGMLKPNPASQPESLGPEGEPVEEAKLQDNLGEFPTLTDQGEQRPPSRVNLGQAAPGGEPLEEAERARVAKPGPGEGAAKGGGGRAGVEAPPRKTGATRRKKKEG
jgi:hypothetical protein